MPQRGEQARFAFERPVRLRRFGDHPLYGNRIVQPQVDGCVHCTHAAFAERPHDSVTLIEKRPCHDVEPTRILVNCLGTWLANVRHRYLYLEVSKNRIHAGGGLLSHTWINGDALETAGRSAYAARRS